MFKKLLLMAYLLCISTQAFCAIAEDSFGYQYTEDYWVTTKTYSFSNTAGTFLHSDMWTWSCASNMTHDTMTYNGSSMSKSVDINRDAGGGCYTRATMWSMQSPATGANNLVINFTGNTTGVMFMPVTMTGVATSSAVDVTDSVDSSCSSISRSVTIGNDGSVVFEHNDNAGNMTPTAGQTERNGGSYLYGVSAGSKTLSWSLDTGCTGSTWDAVVYKPGATVAVNTSSMFTVFE